MATTQQSLPLIEALSEALWNDERILTAGERELLTQVLKQAGVGESNPAPGDDTARRITAAVGEVLTQRLLGLVGSDIANRLIGQRRLDGKLAGRETIRESSAGRSRSDGPGPHPGTPGTPGPHPGTPGTPGPHPGTPGGGPGPHPGTPGTPGPHPGPHHSNFATGGPGPHPGTPGTPGPHPGTPGGGPGPHPGTPGGPGPHPGPHHSSFVMGGPGPRYSNFAMGGPGPRGTATALAAPLLTSDASVLVLDEFLAPQELERLLRYVEARELDFVLSEVVSPGASAGAVDFEHRKSRVLYDAGEHQAVITGRILSYLPRILSEVGLDPFPIAQIEAQITASNDGDFFGAHEDNGEPPLHTRELTFVYFFHHEPKAFRGGELRIYDPPKENSASGAAKTFRTIIPEQNQMVLFRSGLLHEISAVDCPTRAFADSRFTLNGWFHRPE